MKMSDVFDLPFTADAEFQSVCDASGEPLPDFESVEKDRAVVQAINSHDALVELNKELVEAVRELKRIALALCDDGYNYSPIANEATRLLTKAKELLKEQKQ